MTLKTKRLADLTAPLPGVPDEIAWCIQRSQQQAVCVRQQWRRVAGAKELDELSAVEITAENSVYLYADPETQSARLVWDMRPASPDGEDITVTVPFKMLVGDGSHYGYLIAYAERVKLWPAADGDLVFIQIAEARAREAVQKGLPAKARGGELERAAVQAFLALNVPDVQVVTESFMGSLGDSAETCHAFAVRMDESGFIQPTRAHFIALGPYMSERYRDSGVSDERLKEALGSLKIVDHCSPSGKSCDAATWLFKQIDPDDTTLYEESIEAPTPRGVMTLHLRVHWVGLRFLMDGKQAWRGAEVQARITTDYELQTPAEKQLIYTADPDPDVPESMRWATLGHFADAAKAFVAAARYKHKMGPELTEKMSIASSLVGADGPLAGLDMASPEAHAALIEMMGAATVTEESAAADMARAERRSLYKHRGPKPRA